LVIFYRDKQQLAYRAKQPSASSKIEVNTLLSGSTAKAKVKNTAETAAR
jgi:hypothetical protein